MSEVKKPPAWIGCLLSAALVLLCPFACIFSQALEFYRWQSGVEIGCATGTNNKLPAIAKIALVIPPDNCWTDWQMRPFETPAFWITNTSSITVELRYTDNTTEVWQSNPNEPYVVKKDIQGARFKNSGSQPVKVTIQLK